MRTPALLLAAALPVAASAGEPADGPPNVLRIAVDDLNDWIEPLGGHPDALTPDIARLAENGVTFADAHCRAPLCDPSRCSLMTGLRPGTTGIYGLGPLLRQSLYKDRETVNRFFGRHGYETDMAGKVYHHAVGGDEFDHAGPGGWPGALPKEKIAPPTPPQARAAERCVPAG